MHCSECYFVIREQIQRVGMLLERQGDSPGQISRHGLGQHNQSEEDSKNISTRYCLQGAKFFTIL
jgi:hypothetical protein